MKPHANPVTPEDAEKFAGYIAKWRRELNLMDWRIVRGERPAKGMMAEVSITYPARLAQWRLGPHFCSDKVTDFTLEATAAHELLHVLLADLVNAILEKASDDVIEAAEHRIVNTLERLLVPPTNEA